MFYTSRNIADQRDRILFGERYDSKKYSGGIRYFHDLDYDRLKNLLDQKLADPEEQHNCAPEIGGNCGVPGQTQELHDAWLRGFSGA